MRDRTRASERLLWRLRRDCGLDLPPGTTIERTRAGRNMRSVGAWSWYAVDAAGREFTPSVGSPYTVTHLAGCPDLEVYRHPHVAAVEILPGQRR